MFLLSLRKKEKFEGPVIVEKMNTCFIGTISGLVINLAFYVTTRFNGFKREKGD
jgi:hypothetical protein